MRLSTKVLLLVGAASTMGFGTLVAWNTSDQATALLAEHRLRSETLATSVATGIQNIILTGKGALAEELVQDSRALPGVHRLRLYDEDGVEVYLPREKRTGNVDDAAAQVLRTGRAARSGATLIRPLENRRECHRCHGKQGRWRGALAVQIKDAPPAELVFRFVSTAIENVMVSGEAEEVNGFLEAMGGLPWVRAAVVVDNEGTPVFGADEPLPTGLEAPVRSLLVEGGGSVVDDYHLFAVQNSPRCHICHGDDHAVRGVIAVRLGELVGEDVLDAAGPFAELSSWSTWDAKLTNQLDTRGFLGAAFDGRHLFFAPYRTSENDHHGRVLRYDTTAEGASWTLLSDLGAGPAAVVETSEGHFVAAATDPLEEGWHHLALVRDGAGDLALWVDGDPAAESAGPGAIVSAGAPLSNAGDEPGLAVDDVAVWSTALADATLGSRTAPFGTTLETVRTLVPFIPNGPVAKFTGFVPELTEPFGTSVTWQLSNDGGTTWLYWDEDITAVAESASLDDANSAADIDAHVGELAVAGATPMVRAILHSADPSATPSVQAVTLTYDRVQ